MAQSKVLFAVALATVLTSLGATDGED